MRKYLIAAAVLAAIPAIAQPAAPPFTSLDKTGSETTVRHLTNADLGDTLKKAKKPTDFYAEALISKGAVYRVINTIRDKDGQAEIHADWADHIFVQEGEARFATGGTVVEAKVTAPGEQRGTSIKGGSVQTMKPGDYFFIPAGTPHQMLVPAGGRIKFIAFKTHK
jgi:mannose-6-phosphate isomerase-like protein (cupin superfamily)